MTQASFIPFIPFGSLASAKSRLAPVLPLVARQELALAMLENVLGAVGAVDCLAQAVVVTPDCDVADFAQARGTQVAMCAGTSLNADLTGAMADFLEPGVGAAVLMADLPALTAEALTQALGRVPQDSALIASDQTGLGTSLLAWRGLHAMPPFHFGANSFALHSSALAGVPSLMTLDRDPAFNDLDQSEDLHLWNDPSGQRMVAAI